MPLRTACFLAFCLVLVVTLSSAPQQPAPPASIPDDGKMRIDVIVSPKSAIPPEGLKQSDFTLLDNKSPRPIVAFQAVNGRQAPLEVVLVVDAVNSGAIGVNIQREAIDRFLRAESGHLAYPLAVALFTEEGMQIVGNFSLDGNALAGALDKSSAGLRAVGTSGGRHGAEERWLKSQNALRALVASVAPHRRRKIFLWISPGWSELAGYSTELGQKQTDKLFGDVVGMSTLLAKARVTLYSIDPVGAGESETSPAYYQQFLKPVTKPDQVDIGDLALQVLAIKSGGLALHGSNDIAEGLQQCLTDALPFYEITFDPIEADKPNEYHSLEIQLGPPGLTARTRQGYYAQSAPHK
jgi:VWFA-related protein